MTLPKNLDFNNKILFLREQKPAQSLQKEQQNQAQKISVASLLYCSWFSKNPVAKQYTSKLIVVSMLHILLTLILHWRRSGVFIVNFEHISRCSSVSIVNFEHVIAVWKLDMETRSQR